MRCLLNLSGSERGPVTVSLDTVVKFWFMKGWMSLYHQVSLVQVGLCFVQFVKMCILLSVINPSLSVISCTGDVVEEMHNKLTAHFPPAMSW